MVVNANGVGRLVTLGTSGTDAPVDAVARYAMSCTNGTVINAAGAVNRRSLLFRSLFQRQCNRIRCDSFINVESNPWGGKINAEF